ncbi:hypothetical protein DY966_08920 [Pseudomonas aeruginosa]|uniref:P-loop NTPase fold protein n=1 Tax=Pseudomonas aeruginosa TaxID=287 RepID=UPI000F83829D|nr:P-loop NTPase fold protein [Pseudomonas aeruginosa]RTU04618.1 hypothetical protein DY966_08920 [Pseudomonas aeruginosa]
MSVIQVEKALHDFAVRKTGSAIVLKGEWGTGKTYLWNSIIKKYSSNFGRGNYSYVSLFGINSLADLKRSIFENTVPSAKANTVTSKDSVIENLKKLDFSDALGGLRKIFSFGKEAKIPFVGSFGGVIDSIQYSLVSDTIICIDDFERRGKSLSARDVLGLVSNLIESKDCSVILVLNEGSLDKDDEFFIFSEKVFDYEVTFSPSVQESVKLVFDCAGEDRKGIAENAIKLNINNIRLLKKIALFADVLDGALKNSHSRVIQQAHNTLPLAVLAVYGGDKSKVDVDFILTYQGSLFSYMPDDPNASADELESKRIEKEKSSYLDEYGFGMCDEFDVAIINLIKKGYADEDALGVLVDALEKKIKHDADIALLGRAWDLFHSSFGNNEEEVFSAFEQAISKALQYFTLNDLDSIASIYYDVGREGVINSVIDNYCSNILPVSGIREKDEVYPWPRNSYLVMRLDEYFSSLAVKGDLSDLVLAVVKGAGFPDGDLRRGIAQKGDNEFYEYFGGLEGKDFTRHARALLKCGEVRSHDKDITDDFRSIFMKTYGALLKLSELTPLNRVRMSKFKEYEKLYAQVEEESRLEQNQPE